MLALAAAIWGLSTVAIKDSIHALPPFWLCGIRFACSGIILAFVCARTLRDKLDRRSIIAGALLGIVLVLSYACNTVGLSLTSAAKNSFLTSNYCALVPFIAWGISRIRPTIFNIAAVALCCLGITFVSFSHGFEHMDFNLGDGLTLLSAALFALHIALTAKLTNGRSALALTVVQFIVGGIVGLIMGISFEGAFDVHAALAPDVIGNLLYIVLLATCLALSLQNIGVAHVAPTPAALILSTESVFGVVFAVLLLGDVVTPFMLLGFSFIGSGIIVSEVFGARKRKLSSKEIDYILQEELRMSEMR